MRPLITFLVCSYNHEAFIREAVMSALAQDYDPLEIIVQDDCSTDRSTEILNEIAGAHRGPHSLRIHKNELNMGIGGSFSRGVALCRGELIVVGAGDDISMPDRVSTVWETWEASDREALGIFSSYIFMSEDGSESGLGGTRQEGRQPGKVSRLDGDLFRFLSNRKPMVNGCSEAWSPRLFDYFGPVRSDLEDVVLSFRALALGGLYYIDRPLVKWRRHGKNVSFLETEAVASFEDREKRLRWVDDASLKAFDDIMDDIALLSRKGRLSHEEGRRMEAEARRIREYYALEKEMMNGNLVKRMAVFGRALARGRISYSIHIAPRVLPRWLYKTFYLVKERKELASRRRQREDPSIRP